MRAFVTIVITSLVLTILLVKVQFLLEHPLVLFAIFVVVPWLLDLWSSGSGRGCSDQRESLAKGGRDAERAGFNHVLLPPQPVAPANAGRASGGASGVSGPAWLRSPLVGKGNAMRHPLNSLLLAIALFLFGGLFSVPLTPPGKRAAVGPNGERYMRRRTDAEIREDSLRVLRANWRRMLASQPEQSLSAGQCPDFLWSRYLGSNEKPSAP